MRIGVVSDVHGNVPALEAALARFEHEADVVWCAGDIVHEYRFSSPAVGLLRKAGATAVLGNHDMVLLSPAGVNARTAEHVEAEELAWLSGLGLSHETVVDGRRIRMVHGSPWDPYGDYLRAHNPKWKEVDGLGVDILVVGHTHEPMVERFGRTLVVNPGSLGEPRQADRRGSYAVLDTEAGDAEIGYV
ncbi:MAG: putative metallo-dependent phosphatase [Acidimicrobiales bacterium]|jgi:putative phosphoesterase|nr:putative metallo-dependent phosphatase [Acidimicrobiales bacterium]